jgi:hypothetical protein
LFYHSSDYRQVAAECGSSLLPRRIAVIQLSAKLARHSVVVLGLGLLPLARAPRAHTVPSVETHARDQVPPGSYVAVLANGQKLPWTTKVPAVKGLVHWARLDLAVLRLSADGRYTLSYRYTQDVIDSRAPMQMPPARDELSVGRYADRGKTLTFVPSPTKGRATQTVTAQVVGGDIFLDKTVFVGERPFRVRLLFRTPISSPHASRSPPVSCSPRFPACSVVSSRARFSG